MTTPTIAEVCDVLEAHAAYDDCYSGGCPAKPLLARLDPDKQAICDRDSLAAALRSIPEPTFLRWSVGAIDEQDADAILAALREAQR